VALDRKVGDLRQQLGETLLGQVAIEPVELGGRAYPDAEIGVAALIARTCSGNSAERDADRRLG
jgi:hypothetical protein